MSTDAEIEAFIEHVGVKGMKWGVRKSPAQISAKTQAKDTKKLNKAEVKAKSKLTTGELVVSGMFAGPVGILTYKALKKNAAQVKQANRGKSPAQQDAIAKKVGIGEGIAVAMLTTPIGFIGYAIGKSAASTNVGSFDK